MTSVINLWDLPLRTFHWLLVITLVASYATGTENGLWLEWHLRLGLFVIALMVFRLVWGFVGPTYVRFGYYFPTLSRLKDYWLSDWHSPGHTPLGALSIFSMFALILAQAGTGLFTIEEDIEIYGPLSQLVNANLREQLTNWHTIIIDWLLIISALHVLAIGYYMVFKRKNLIGPMLTGKLVVSDYTPAGPTRNTKKRYLVLAIVLSALAVWLIQADL